MKKRPAKKSAEGDFIDYLDGLLYSDDFVTLSTKYDELLRKYRRAVREAVKKAIKTERDRIRRNYAEDHGMWPGCRFSWLDDKPVQRRK